MDDKAFQLLIDKIEKSEKNIKEHTALTVTSVRDDLNDHIKSDQKFQGNMLKVCSFVAGTIFVSACSYGFGLI